MTDINKDAKRKPSPPRNEIIPQKLGDRIMQKLDSNEDFQYRLKKRLTDLETKLDGIIVDQDIAGVEINVIKSSVGSQGLWNWIRDIIVIILLVTIFAFMGYRGYVVEKHLQEIESSAAESDAG